MKLIDDMFKTDGKWDASATGWALTAWLLAVLAFLVHSFWHPPATLMDFGTAAGTILGGGGLGTYLHSRSTP